MSGVFEKKTWTGEFYKPGERENRFIGRLEYKYGSGLGLYYQIPDDRKIMCDVLHGELLTGEKCTLDVLFRHESMFRRLTKSLLTAGPRYALIGGHFKKDKKFDSVKFSLTV